MSIFLFPFLSLSIVYTALSHLLTVPISHTLDIGYLTIELVALSFQPNPIVYKLSYSVQQQPRKNRSQTHFNVTNRWCFLCMAVQLLFLWGILCVHCMLHGGWVVQEDSKSFEGFKDVGGGMIYCMSGLSPSSVTKHTQITSLSPVSWCVSLYWLYQLYTNKTFKGFKPINEMFPFHRLVPGLFLVYWFIMWSVLFSLRTSKPLGGALNSSSCSSACPPVISLRSLCWPLTIMQPVSSFRCQQTHIDEVTVIKYRKLS